MAAPASARALVLAALLMQNVGYTLLRRYSQGVLHEQYSFSELLLLGELVKLVVAAIVTAAERRAERAAAAQDRVARGELGQDARARRDLRRHEPAQLHRDPAHHGGRLHRVRAAQDPHDRGVLRRLPAAQALADQVARARHARARRDARLARHALAPVRRGRVGRRRRRRRRRRQQARPCSGSARSSSR